MKTVFKYSFQTMISDMKCNQRRVYHTSSHSSRFLHGALIKEWSHQTVTDPADPMNNLLILNYDFRHEMQLEKSISQSSHSSRFLHGALIKERSHQTVTDPADPMNNLKDIMETITYRPFKRRHRRNRKDDSYKSGCTLECCTGQSETSAAHSATKCDKCDSLEECPLEHRELLVATCMEKPADYEAINNMDLAGDEKTRNIQVLENDNKTTNDLDLENGNKNTNTQDLGNDDRIAHIQDLENDDRTTNNIKLAENDQSNSTALRLAKTQVSFGHSECSRNDLSFGQSECSRNEDKSDCTHSGNKSSDKSDQRRDEEVPPSNDEAIETIPEHIIRTYKLSAEEIKKLPRFENYDPGEPNNVS